MTERLVNLKKMHNIILRMNNSMAYEIWTIYMPDDTELNDDMLLPIAQDISEYNNCVDLFIRLVDRYTSGRI